MRKESAHDAGTRGTWCGLGTAAGRRTFLCREVYQPPRATARRSAWSMIHLQVVSAVEGIGASAASQSRPQGATTQGRLRARGRRWNVCTSKRRLLPGGMVNLRQGTASPAMRAAEDAKGENSLGRASRWSPLRSSLVVSFSTSANMTPSGRSSTAPVGMGPALPARRSRAAADPRLCAAPAPASMSKALDMQPPTASAVLGPGIGRGLRVGSGGRADIAPAACGMG